jgi:hypothetical protein
MRPRAAKVWCGYRRHESDEEHAGGEGAAPADPLE